MLDVSAAAAVLLNYLGGYPLHPKKGLGDVEAHRFGVTVSSGLRHQRRMFLPWKDVVDISLEGMMDQQRQRSLARTVEFGALGGLAGKNVKSAYLTVTTAIGAAVFHTDKLTLPELRSKYGAVLPPAQAVIASRNAAPAPARPPAAPPVSIADELSKLAALKADGILTDEEFAAQKARLLGG
jgi:hypothetical protein